MVLQLVLTKCLNYEHLGRLREVHPHWDEIAGQLLNSGYYKLLERSDKLLMTLQRKVVSDPGLHYATSVLTNIQMHILNPVDIMRAVLDEGGGFYFLFFAHCLTVGLSVGISFQKNCFKNLYTIVLNCFVFYFSFTKI